MLSSPLTRIVRCAAVVAVLCTVLFPPQSLVCRNCLVQDLSEFDSGVDHAKCDDPHDVKDEGHGHSCDGSEHCGSKGDSHENCPCELTNVDAAMVVAPNAFYKINVEFIASSLSADSSALTPIQITAGVDSNSLSRRPSLPLVLRI